MIKKMMAAISGVLLSILPVFAQESRELGKWGGTVIINAIKYGFYLIIMGVPWIVGLFKDDSSSTPIWVWFMGGFVVFIILKKRGQSAQPVVIRG